MKIVSEDQYREALAIVLLYEQQKTAARMDERTKQHGCHCVSGKELDTCEHWFQNMCTKNISYE